MPTVRTERTIEAPIGDVFELLTDHANYKQFSGISDSELLREGEADRNGVGAMRRVTVGPIRFEEEITAFERPARMGYLIRKVNVPLEHEGGTIRLEAIDDATRVVWESTFRFTTPGIGGLIGVVGAPSTKLGFDRVLRDVDRRLTG